MPDYKSYLEKFRSSKITSIPPEKIVAWLEHNFDCKPRKQNVEYCINNPFTDDNGYHFGINVETGLCHDWRGDTWAGPPSKRTGKRNCFFIHFVELYLKCDRRTALKAVLGTSVDLSDYLKTNREPEATADAALALPEGAELLARAQGLNANLVRNKLKSRGVTQDVIESHRLHCLGSTIVWPYYEFDELVYWQSRSCINKTFRFPDANVGVTKGDFFYGFDYAQPSEYVIIVEAIFGYHTLGEQCLASGGAALTERQARKLKLLNPKRGIILAPDNDKAGIKSLSENHKLLVSHGFTRLFYSIPPKLPYGDDKVTKDWNELLTGTKMSLSDVRQLHDSRVKRLDMSELIKLRLS